jgi:hypothetical protein
VIERQLGRTPRGVTGVAARCPFGRPAVTAQAAYLEGGEPFPTTYYLTCPHAVARVSALESDGGVERWEARAAADPVLRRSLCAAARRQASLRRPAERMLDGGAGLGLGVGGTAHAGALKCLHAHVAFALAEPGYLLGERIVDEAAPLFPDGACCTP